jgi:lipoprotein-anchoring transpeptidase ErfK/SrfK
MFRFVLTLSAVLTTFASAQIGAVPQDTAQPVAPAAAAQIRPVLRAQPLDDATPDTPIQMAAPQVSANTKPSGDNAVRLQIFLDEAMFGPGIIDGKPGRFTELAVQSWNESNGYAADSWSEVTQAALTAVPDPFANAVVPENCQNWVDPTLPTKRSLQAQRKRMSYRSIAEFMAERFHCDVPYLIELNGAKKINNLIVGDTIIVPNVQPFAIELLTEKSFLGEEKLSQRHVVVDTKMNQVRIFEAAPAALVVAEPGVTTVTPISRPNRGLVSSFPITPGKPQFIKFGTWELKNMVQLPWWRYDQQLLDTGVRSKEALNIPAGPNSPVGVIWNGTSKSGIGLHGTSDPETIGRARSAGCIRLANWDAIRLPLLVRPGATVEIR